MKQLAKILRLDFLPLSTDCGLLALRLWVGLSMLLLHGWDKVINFDKYSQKFIGLFGLSPSMSLALAIFAEAVCSALLVLGLFTRFAALNLIVTMCVAFFIAHKGVLKGEGSGEMAFIYLAAYVVMFLAGPGRYSADAKMGGKV